MPFTFLAHTTDKDGKDILKNKLELNFLMYSSLAVG